MNKDSPKKKKKKTGYRAVLAECKEIYRDCIALNLSHLPGCFGSYLHVVTPVSKKMANLRTKGYRAGAFCVHFPGFACERCWQRARSAHHAALNMLKKGSLLSDGKEQKNPCN